MPQGYLTQVQKLIDEKFKDNPDGLKQKLKEIEEAKKAPKSPPKPSIDLQLTQELIEELNQSWDDASLQKVKDLIKRGADIKVEGYHGTTLHQACWKGDLELIEFCLQSGVDPHLGNIANSRNALYFAEVGDASHLFREMQSIFKKYGAL